MLEGVLRLRALVRRLFRHHEEESHVRSTSNLTLSSFTLTILTLTILTLIQPADRSEVRDQHALDQALHIVRAAADQDFLAPTALGVPNYAASEIRRHRVQVRVKHQAY